MNSPETGLRPSTTNFEDDDSGTVTDAASAARLTAAPRWVGPYALFERIGRGGLGDVYRARHPERGEVALKLLRGGDDATPAERRSFKRELAAARRLSHPDVLPILDDGTHDGAPYYVMPLVRGGSLERRTRAGRFAPNEAAALVARVARAVHAAHVQGVIHRDLKPANVLLRDDGTPIVADFGLARFLDQATAYTKTGQLMGSVPYMAPEQAAGRSHTASPATDVWALGVVLYELLAGERPFRGETQTDVLHRIQFDDPSPPSTCRADVPASLELVCLKCLRKSPRARYASAALLATDLERWLAGEPIDAAVHPPPTALARAWERRPGAALLACAAGLLTAALLLLAPPPEPAAVLPADSPEDAARAALRKHLATAAPGRPVVLLSEGRPATWGKLVAGAFQNKFAPQPGVRPWLETADRWLFELLPPDPGRGDFRLLVKLEQERGDAVSEVGLYAHHRHVTRGKDEVHAYAMATYHEHTFAPNSPDPDASLILVGQVDKPNGTILHDTVQTGASVRLAPPPQDGPRIRTLAIEARDTRVGVVAPGRPAQFPEPARLRLAMKLFAKKPNPAGLLPDESPGAGAGIVVWGAGVTIHRVLYEPLPPPR